VAIQEMSMSHESISMELRYKIEELEAELYQIEQTIEIDAEVKERQETFTLTLQDQIRDLTLALNAKD
jgi:hypothetical protein